MRGRGVTRRKWKLGILAAIALSVIVSSRYQDIAEGAAGHAGPH